mgnify:CR=1 FL=1
MCPEHTKELKTEDFEVCGCPLQSEEFYALPLDQIKHCQLSKKNCKKHFAWDRMYRAEIDIKRIRTLVQLDANLDERRKLEFVMSNRNGSALLMMNKTIQHTDITDLRPEIRKKETEKVSHKIEEDSGINAIIKSEVKTEISVV